MNGNSKNVFAKTGVAVLKAWHTSIYDLQNKIKKW